QREGGRNLFFAAPRYPSPHRALLRGCALRCRGAAVHRPAASDPGSGGGAGRRSRDCCLSDERLLGCDRQIELGGPALPVADLSDAPRARCFLFRALLQPSRREDTARLFASGESCAIRSDRVDDHRGTAVGHSRISGRYETHSDFSSHPPHVYGRTLIQGGAVRAGRMSGWVINGARMLLLFGSLSYSADSISMTASSGGDQKRTRGKTPPSIPTPRFT